MNAEMHTYAHPYYSQEIKFMHDRGARHAWARRLSARGRLWRTAAGDASVEDVTRAFEILKRKKAKANTRKANNSAKSAEQI